MFILFTLLYPVSGFLSSYISARISGKSPGWRPLAVILLTFASMFSVEQIGASLLDSPMEFTLISFVYIGLLTFIGVFLFSIGCKIGPCMIPSVLSDECSAVPKPIPPLPFYAKDLFITVLAAFLLLYVLCPEIAIFNNILFSEENKMLSFTVLKYVLSVVLLAAVIGVVIVLLKVHNGSYKWWVSIVLSYFLFSVLSMIYASSLRPELTVSFFVSLSLCFFFIFAVALMLCSVSLISALAFLLVFSGIPAKVQ